MLSELLGWDLTDERHRRGATQQQLAEELEVDVATVSRWENGHGLPCAQHQLTLRRWFANELAA